MDYEKEILTWIFANFDAWGSALAANGPDDWWANRWRDARYDQPAYQNAHFGARYDPSSWMERSLAAAERQGFSRAVKDLASRGLIVPVCRHGSRVSHIQLTPRGLAVAIGLTGVGDLAGIKKAFSTAVWATPEHLLAIRQAIREANK